MYADFSFYKSEWAGALVPASEFEKYARKAERLIKFVTHNRAAANMREVKNAYGQRTEDD